ncbi:hypothetical protein RINTU1_13830 [Candidatus Regiella insecticola]|uniref:Uncharacterized protein n=1 Tax=Candidatus Regiella insecticola TaxID=138073 RepID=A0A6L2ZP72_9ENTR|nr:hypothetical protein RINTU1_13830 [Candidatus Regiella insecticola]
MIQGGGAQTVQIVQQATTTLKSNQTDLAIKATVLLAAEVHPNQVVCLCPWPFKLRRR